MKIRFDQVTVGAVYTLGKNAFEKINHELGALLPRHKDVGMHYIFDAGTLVEPMPNDGLVIDGDRLAEKDEPVLHDFPGEKKVQPMSYRVTDRFDLIEKLANLSSKRARLLDSVTAARADIEGLEKDIDELTDELAGLKV